MNFLILLFKPIARAFAWCISHLPQAIQMFLGDLFGILWFDILRIRRSVVLQNLDIAFPQKSQQEKIAIGRASCQNMGRCFVEYFRIPFLKQDDWSLNQFQIEGLHHLEAAEAKGRGVCLLALHLGSADFAGCGMSLLGKPVTIISKHFKMAWLNDIWFGLRASLGTGFIPPRNSTFLVLKALKNKKIVVFVQDQFMGPPIGIRTSFFGKETGTALGLAMIATRTETPIVPNYTYRRADGKIIICFDPVVEIPAHENPEKQMELLTQKCNDILQSYVERYPEQWMWVHRRWKRFKV